MSGKFENKKKKNSSGKKNASGRFSNAPASKKKESTSAARQKPARGVRIALIALLSLLAILIIYGVSRGSDDSGTAESTVPANTQVVSVGGTESVIMEEIQLGTVETGTSSNIDTLELGSGVHVTKLLAYTGAFMEDRTDEIVSNVLAIQVTNSGDKYIQAMDITLTAGETQAVFSLSTLMPGETVIVLEKNRMAYSDSLEFTEAAASSVALFSEAPSMCEDKLEIQCLNGIINVTNISDEDITGDIVVYYKNCIDGIYYGGITYRLRIEGGLKAGEIRQGTAAHFHPSNSTVVFVTCG